MKRLITLLFLILSLATMGQTVHYYPSYTDSYARVPGQEVAVLVRLPTGYTAEKKWPWKLFVHGMGQRGPGTVAALKTVWEGNMQAIPEDWKTSCDANGIVGVVVNYNNFFQPSSWVWTINFIKSKYSLVDLGMGQGFSWGGGSLQNFYCTSSTYAGMLAVAIPIAPTVEYNQGWENVGKAKLPVCVMVNKGDNVTGAAAAKNSVNYINASSPAIPATYLEFPVNGHGGTNEALSKTPPLGLVETVDLWYLDVLANGPRPPKKVTGTPTTPVPPPATTGPVLKLQALPAITTTGSISLQGCGSSSYESFTWTVISVPKSASLWSPYINGAGTCNTSAKFTIEGAYAIKATACKASSCVSDTLYTTFQKVSQPVPVVPITYDSRTGYLVLSDGSRVRATATIDWATKKVVVKDEAGVTYTW